MDGHRRGHCISPLLYRTGLVSVEISSDNGTTFNRVGTWLSGTTSTNPSLGLTLAAEMSRTPPLCLFNCVAAVHTGKLDSKFKAAMVNSTQWQYYGTPNVAGTLEMTWNPSLVRADKVNIELWGYRETGERTGTWNYTNSPETW